jgi:TfoX/Sxy family transcriptional regulator of competence genes
MAGAETLVSRVRAALAHIPGVEEKRMFGSIGFIVRGKLCIGARTERIMCRIDPERHDAALRRNGCRTVIMKGRAYRGYVYVDAESVGTKRALQSWLELALDYNEAVTRTQRKAGKRVSPRGRGR